MSLSEWFTAVSELEAANKPLRDRLAELEAAMHEAGLTFEDDPAADEDGGAFPAGVLRHGWAG